jgi:hypothetical protein
MVHISIVRLFLKDEIKFAKYGLVLVHSLLSELLSKSRNFDQWEVNSNEYN